MRISTLKIITIQLLTILLLPSCKEDYYDPYFVVPSPFTGVPDSFNWSTISSVNLTVKVNDEYNGAYYYVVEVFDQNPVLTSNTTLLAKGVAKGGEAYVSEVNFPQALETIYIRQTAPDGLKTVLEQTINAQNITIDFSGSASLATAKSKRISTRSTTVPTYKGNRTGATSIDLTASSTILTAGKSYVITGGTYSGGITFYGGNTTTLFVEGEWNMPSNQGDFQTGLEIVVLNGGKITFAGSSKTIQGNGNVDLFIMSGGNFNPNKNSININFSNSGGNVSNFGELNLIQMKLNGGKFYNDSKTMTISEFNQTGTIENHGTLTLGSINSNYGLTIDNYSNMVVTGNLTCQGTTIKNQGLLTLGSLNSSSGLSIDNYCNMTVTGDFNCSGAVLNLHGSTILSCINFSSQGTTVNMDAFSLLDVTGTTTFTSWSSTLHGTGSGTDFALARLKKVVCTGSGSVTYNGNLELECSDHTAKSLYYFPYYLNSPARMVSYGSPTVLIPASECTGAGSYPQGTKPVDPVFPIEVPTSSIYTYAIEDFWPAYGDYDMNDLVVENQTTFKVDEKNMVTSMTITARLTAVGASKKLGAAFQLDRVLSGNIKSVSVVSDSPNNRLTGTVFTIGSKGIETGQTQAVIPLFNEAHHFLLNSGSERYDLLNTTTQGQYITPKQVKITIDFVSGNVSQNDIAVKYLNFFVVTDAQTENRKEVHLPGYAPTNKATTSYFGGGPNNIPSNNDLSLNGVYYRGTDNLIWALMIPGSFNYPMETKSIIIAYPKFKEWAVSGGVNNKDWYGSSNADPTYIYTNK